MSIPSTIAEYLSCFSQELGDRILEIYPALQALLAAAGEGATLAGEREPRRQS